MFVLNKRRGIALLITLLFIIAITVSVGIGLKYLNTASNEVQKEKFIIQTRTAISDILKILQKSKEIDYIVKNNSAEALYIFLSQSSFIPFENAGVRMILQIKSARSKFNPNMIMDKNITIQEQRAENLKEYISNNDINPVFVDIMLDTMGGIKEDLVYNSDIFYEKPELFRDRLVSLEHFNEIKDFFELTYHENSLKNIDFDNLFYFSKDKNLKIDLNYATAEVLEMILGVDKLRAKEIAQNKITYTKLDDMELSEDEKDMLSRFKTSFFEPYLDVKIEIIQDDNSAKIEFEYDLKARKGMNFSYDI